MAAQSKPKAGPSNDQNTSANVSGNLDLWNALKRTDPKATKPFQRSGFKGTQIDPYWRYFMMTEAFGPIGKGWGYDLTDPIITEGLIFIGASVWYIDPESGEKCISGMQYGGDVLFKSRREGPSAPNDEAMKMAVTDAVGKAASLLGLGADIYMGQFDDSKYREESVAFFTQKNAIASNPDLQPPAIAKYEADLKEKLDGVADLDQLDDLWRSGVNSRIREIGSVDKAAQNRMISAFSAKKTEITKRDEERQAS